MTINIKSPHEYLNATVVGTPTISEGVVSGFSSGNYLKLPETFNPESNSWEAVIKFATLSDFSAQQIILHPASSSGVNVALVVDTTGKILAYASTDGSSWNILNSTTGTTILSPSTSYYIKMQYTGTAYEVYLSTDGNTFNLELSVSSSSFVKSGFYLTLGAWASDGRHVESIDLNESYIKINGEYWWKGMELDQYKEISRLYRYDKPRYFKDVTDIVHEAWTRPNLSANGTVGGDSFAVSSTKESASNYAWKAVDGNTSTYWQANSSANGHSFTFYNPNKLNVTKLDFTYYGGGYGIRSGILYASDDNSTWVELKSFTSQLNTWDVSDNANYYHYYKIYVVSGGSESNIVDVKELAITATQEIVTTSTVEVTANDEYDYIEFNPLTIKQVYKTDKPTYFKYDGGREHNVDVVGSIYENFDGVGNFGDGKYFTFDIGTTELSDLVELYLSFSTGKWSDESSKASGILGGDNFPLIQIYNQKVNLGGNSATGSYTYSTYEDVKWKIQIQNGVCKIYRLNENNEYELDLTFDYTTPISGTVRVGWNSSTRYLKYGYVYYDGTYVNVNGERRWTITKPVNYKEVEFTFPELTSEGSIGGNEFGIQALTDNVTGLMNMFQPLVDGKVQNGVYMKSAAESEILFYSPASFMPRFVRWYYGVESDGTVDENRAGFIELYPSDNGIDWGNRYTLAGRGTTADEYYEYGAGTNIIPSGKYWKIILEDEYKIGKLIISGYTEESLTASDDYDYKELIPTLVYEDNGTVFEQSTAGTYTFTVTETAPYEITLVGGGGGGAFNSSGNAGSAAAGNSGSGLVVNANLKAGTYVLTVGAGGAKSGWLDANTWGGNGAESKITKDGVVIATAGGGTGNHCWWRSGSERNSTVGAAPTYTDALGVTDVILNTQGNWGGLAATSSGGASVISGTTWGKGGDTRNRNAADNGNAGCIRIVRLEK